MTKTFLWADGFADAIVNAVRTPLLVLGEDLRVERANQAFYRTFGLSPATTENRPLTDLDSGSWNLPAVLDLVATARQSAEPGGDVLVEQTFPAAGDRILLLSARSISRPAGLPSAQLLTIEDITERRHAEMSLAEHMQELARSNAALETFAYAASHDLQEPLRMVAGFSAMLGRRYRGRLDADGDEIIAHIVDGAARMQRLIDDLLGYSKMASRDLTIGEVACESAVDEAVARLESLLGPSEGTITRDALPLLRGDRSLLAQLFQNLIGNALKFRGPAAPKVHVSAVRRGEYWEIAVTDNGIGIPPDYHERIFKMFQRLHGGGEYAGNGIGLALCQGIVERHGGRIWVDSTPGEGSTFRFTWPAHEGGSRVG